MSAAALQADNISWGCSTSNAVILHPTSFHLAAGRVLGIVGANGAGKTTLLRLIYRYVKPISGTVRVDGDDIWSLSPRACAQRIAAVLQEQPTDFALTVRDVVALGRIPHKRSFASAGKGCAEQIDRAMERMGLTRLANRAFGTLSGGERQRCMVARALAQEPKLLIMDEPTNHLDIRHQLEVLELIRELDMTIVTSLHDLNLAASVCDDILLLQSGRALCFGPPSDVLSSEQVSTAFGVQALAEELSLSNRRHFTYRLPSKDTGIPL